MHPHENVVNNKNVSNDRVKEITNEPGDIIDEGSSLLNYLSLRYFIPFTIVAKAVFGTENFTLTEFINFVINFDVMADNYFCGKSRIKIEETKAWSADLKDFAQKAEGNSRTIAALKTIVLKCNPVYTGMISSNLEERIFLKIMTHMRNGTTPEGELIKGNEI